MLIIKKEIRGISFEIYEDGRIFQEGKEKETIENENGYKSVEILGKYYFVHRIVAKEFYSEKWDELLSRGEKIEVHHKNRKRGDNNMNNLMVLSKEEHKKLHALEDDTYLKIKPYMIGALGLEGYDLLIYALVENFTLFRDGLSSNLGYIKFRTGVDEKVSPKVLKSLEERDLIKSKVVDGKTFYKSTYVR